MRGLKEPARLILVEGKAVGFGRFRDAPTRSSESQPLLASGFTVFPSSPACGILRLGAHMSTCLTEKEEEQKTVVATLVFVRAL